MIDFATKKDHLEIIPVWQSGFDDNADDVAEFLAGTDGFCDRLVFREDEKIVAEMNIIRCDLSVEEKRASAVYFYALATLPEYRGRGIMSSMIRFALDKYAADGIGYAMIELHLKKHSVLYDKLEQMREYYPQVDFRQVKLKPLKEVWPF